MTNDTLERTENCLVVDDVCEIRTSLVKILTHLGYDVVAAASGEEALALLGDSVTAISMALIDMQMPGLSGIETQRRIRMRLPGLPVLLMSALPANSFSSELESVTGYAFLQKPFTIAELRREIAALKSECSCTRLGKPVP